eukprot:3076440-Amphidinium_carterae.1
MLKAVVRYMNRFCTQFGSDATAVTAAAILAQPPLIPSAVLTSKYFGIQLRRKSLQAIFQFFRIN